MLPAALTLPTAADWTTVSFTVSNFTPKTVGIQIDAYGDSNTVIALDAVTW
jgi:hypothetical protein